MFILRSKLEIAHNFSQVSFNSSTLPRIKSMISLTIAGLLYYVLMVIVRLILLFL